MTVLLTSPLRAAPLRVNVEVEATRATVPTAVDPNHLGRWLRERLEQEGYAVVFRGEPADTQLRVSVEEHTLELRATGEQEVTDSVELGDFDVMALELLHKAMAALGKVRRGKEPPDRAGEPASVVQPPTEPAPRPEPGPTKEVIAASRARDVPAGARSPAPRSATDQAVTSPRADVSTGRLPLAWSLDAGGGFVGRGSAYDPGLRLSATACSTQAPVAARAQVELTSAGAPSLSVWETTWQAGPLLHLHLYRQLAALAGVMGGAYVHYYHYDGDDHGFRYSWAISVPAELVVQTGKLQLGAGGRVGLTGRLPTHRLFARPLWERRSTSWGLEAFVGWAL